MSTTSLAIFKQLFLKNPKDIKDIFTNVTAFVKDKDKAIAEFLSVEYPELIWLVRVLHIAYDKQFSLNILKQPQVVENIARSITLTVDETGTLDYGQQEHNTIVYNILETHLSTQQLNLSSNHHQKASDDVISLGSSEPASDMELVYQPKNTFKDLALLQCPTQSKDKNPSHLTPGA